MKIKLNNAGDTIIEVLIAVAILSLVLVGAYSIANRSSAAIRQAQEHTEALKLAEGQLEQIRQISENGGQDKNGRPILNTAWIDFCVDNNEIKFPPGNCTINNGIDYTIKTNVSNPMPTPNIYTFVVNVSWENIHGGSNDNVRLSYNLDK